MNKEDSEKTYLSVANANHDDKSDLIQLTTYIRPDQALALDILETAEQQSRGTGFDKAELIQEAIDLLIERRLLGIRVGKPGLVSKSGSEKGEVIE